MPPSEHVIREPGNYGRSIVARSIARFFQLDFIGVYEIRGDDRE